MGSLIRYWRIHLPRWCASEFWLHYIEARSNERPAPAALSTDVGSPHSSSLLQMQYLSTAVQLHVNVGLYRLYSAIYSRFSMLYLACGTVAVRRVAKSVGYTGRNGQLHMPVGLLGAVQRVGLMVES